MVRAILPSMTSGMPPCGDRLRQPPMCVLKLLGRTLKQTERAFSTLFRFSKIASATDKTPPEWMWRCSHRPETAFLSIRCSRRNRDILLRAKITSVVVVHRGLFSQPRLAYFQLTIFQQYFGTSFMWTLTTYYDRRITISSGFNPRLLCLTNIYFGQQQVLFFG